TDVLPIIFFACCFGIAMAYVKDSANKTLADAAETLYQVSNAACLGRSEEEFCRNMDTVIRNLIRQEIDAREQLLTGPGKLRTEDAVFRALGVLRHARSISYGEFMQNMSLARMGAAMGWAIGLDFSTFNQLTLLMQPAHIQAAAGRALTPEERDAFRADSLRKKLN
ncbi:MAG TPA: hypothetical protein PKI19_04745, partial [Elusimicrobiales bacterium]|nr:hypothetical protein [Elusimicrobiales bacterium]